MLSDSVAQRPSALALDGIATEMADLEAILQDVSRTEYLFIRDIIRAAFGASGKRLRPMVALLSGQLAAAAVAPTLSLAASVETLHVASLVHDDVIYQAFIRRGHPALNAHLSAEVMVLAGDYLFARAAAFAAETGSPRVVRVFSDCLMTICVAQLAQLTTRRSVPGRDECLTRMYGKTAALFATAAECGAILGAAEEAGVSALRAYGERLGLAWQIVDDALGFLADSEGLGKPAGLEVGQRMLTLPALYASADGAAPLADALAGDMNAVAEVIDVVREGNALDLALADARAYADAAVAALSWFPPVAARQALERLAHVAVERSA